jgi:small subunit ribosomal protein S16
VLKIRLRRMGAKKDAFYRIVVSDSRATPGSRFIDVLGTYDPKTEPATVKLDRERAEEWIRKGAQASDTVKSLISGAATLPA